MKRSQLVGYQTSEEYASQQASGARNNSFQDNHEMDGQGNDERDK